MVSAMPRAVGEVAHVDDGLPGKPDAESSSASRDTGGDSMSARPGRRLLTIAVESDGAAKETAFARDALLDNYRALNETYAAAVERYESSPTNTPAPFAPFKQSGKSMRVFACWPRGRFDGARSGLRWCTVAASRWPTRHS